MGEQGRSSVKHIKAGPAQFCVCLCVCVYAWLNDGRGNQSARNERKGSWKKKKARSWIEALVVWIANTLAGGRSQCRPFFWGRQFPHGNKKEKRNVLRQGKKKRRWGAEKKRSESCGFFFLRRWKEFKKKKKTCNNPTPSHKSEVRCCLRSSISVLRRRRHWAAV